MLELESQELESLDLELLESLETLKTLWNHQILLVQSILLDPLLLASLSVVLESLEQASHHQHLLLDLLLPRLQFQSVVVLTTHLSLQHVPPLHRAMSPSVLQKDLEVQKLLHLLALESPKATLR